MCSVFVFITWVMIVTPHLLVDIYPSVILCLNVHHTAIQLACLQYHSRNLTHLDFHVGESFAKIFKL